MKSATQGRSKEDAMGVTFARGNAHDAPVDRTRLAMGSASYISHLTAKERIVDCED